MFDVMLNINDLIIYAFLHIKSFYFFRVCPINHQSYEIGFSALASRASDPDSQVVEQASQS